MSEKSLKKEFHMEIDELVDNLLENVKAKGWGLAKMQYELGSLSASQENELLDRSNGGNVLAKYDLTATWQDFGDALELEVAVRDSEHEWNEAICAKKCVEIIDGIEDKKAYENLYSENTDFVFDEFESNN